MSRPEPDPKLVELANKSIELEEKIRLEEALWSAALVPTENLLDDIDQLIQTTNEILQLTKGKGHATKELERFVRRWKRKRTHYRKALKELKKIEVIE